MPGDRPHDVSGLTSAELERARRDLEVSLALAFPGSPVRVPILAEMSAIDAELDERQPADARADDHLPVFVRVRHRRLLTGSTVTRTGTPIITSGAWCGTARPAARSRSGSPFALSLWRGRRAG